jgi:hypothetical protein
MQSPLVRKSCLRVETLADLEGVGQRTAGTGNLFSHASEEDLTGFVPALQLRIWFFEVDHPVDVGVEATTLRAHHQHGASLEQVAVRDEMPVVAMRLSAAARSTGLRSPVAGRSPAGLRQVAARFAAASYSLIPVSKELATSATAAAASAPTCRYRSRASGSRV